MAWKLLEQRGMPKPKQDPKPSEAEPPRARSPKPGAGQEPRDSTDILRDEAERTKASSSAERRKRTHKQSSARTEEAVEPDRPARED